MIEKQYSKRGAIPCLVYAGDNGSFSNKVVSGESEGSFWSVAAPVGVNAMSDFRKVTDPNSYDLDIFYSSVDNKGMTRFLERDRQRWIVGKEALGWEGVQRTTRDMDRFNQKLFTIFACAQLRVAFPEHGHPAQDLRDNSGIVDRRWMVNCKMVASIAPAYYGKSTMLAEAAKGEYVFIDNLTDTLYCFRVDEVIVVPESYGGFASRLWELDANGGLAETKEKNALERITCATLDFGGRTTDYMKFLEKKVLKAGSEDFGLHMYVDIMIDQVMASFPGSFARKPTEFEIMDAIKMRKASKGKVLISGRDNKSVDMTDVVEYNMNVFANRVNSIYENSLDSGQGIQVLFMLGGVALTVDPYLDIKHQKKVFVSKDYYKLYMANAMGGYLYGMSEVL